MNNRPTTVATTNRKLMSMFGRQGERESQLYPGVRLLCHAHDKHRGIFRGYFKEIEKKKNSYSPIMICFQLNADIVSKKPSANFHPTVKKDLEVISKK